MPKLGARPAIRAVLDLADLIAGLILIAITLLNLAAVFMRYVMLDSITWSEEIMRYGSIWLTFLAAAAVSYRSEHLSLDLFRFIGSERFQRWHEAILHLLAAFFAATVLWQGVRYCLKNGMQTAPTTGMLMLWAYGAIVVGGALLLLAELLRSYDSLTGTAEPVAHEDPAI